jgi:hypothetical protein
MQGRFAKRLIVAVAAGLAAAAIIGVLAISAHGSSTDWPCDNLMHASGDHVTGFPTEDEALKRAELILEGMPGFTGTSQQLDEALASDQGPTRYDPTTGNLFIDGVLAAQFSATKLSDGTYIADEVTTCAPKTAGGASSGPGA